METTKNRFALGVLLAWAPWVVTVFGIYYLIRAVPGTKATGFTAGFGEMLVLWGLATMLIAQVLAIVWLWRSFSREKMLNNLVGGVSIAMSGLTLLATGLFVWTILSLP